MSKPKIKRASQGSWQLPQDVKKVYNEILVIKPIDKEKGIVENFVDEVIESKINLLIRDTPLGKAYVLGTFLTREVTDMGFKVASRVRGLSDEAFREAFGAEEQCRSALSRLRWPDGFVCPACGHRGHCVLAGRSLYQCYRCKKQTSSTAGTIFHATKLPLTLWFAAVHLIVTAKNGISSVELGRRLGVKQPTAWTMKHKIMAVMARREADTPLSGRVEMDDAYLGGARAGGKRGRGAPGKTPFVAAVSTSPEGRPRKVKVYNEILVIKPIDKEKGIVENFVDDTVIESKINALLLDASGVNVTNFRYRSVGGMVFLFGRALSRAELQKAISVIKSIENVSSVKDRVMVRPRG